MLYRFTSKHRSPSENVIKSNDGPNQWPQELLVIRISRPFAAESAAYWVMKNVFLYDARFGLILRFPSTLFTRFGFMTSSQWREMSKCLLIFMTSDFFDITFFTYSHERIVQCPKVSMVGLRQCILVRKVLFCVHEKNPSKTNHSGISYCANATQIDC